jgi:cell division protein FtsI/penicillin-binding protein 2
MAKLKQLRRLLWLALLLTLAFAGLAYRLVDLQVLRHEELFAKARANTEHEFLLEPHRGEIRDIKGNPLATSVLVKNICADPCLIAVHTAEFAHVLAPLLQTNEAKLVQLLAPRIRIKESGETLTNHYVCLKRKVSVDTWHQIQVAVSNLTFGVDEKNLKKAEQAIYNNLRQKGVFARDDQLRVYPNQSLAAHVLGFTFAEEKEINDTPVTDIAGRDGIEMMFNEKLAGVRGWRVTERDNLKREVVTLREQDVEPCDGLNVFLTLDSFVQQALEKALADAMQQHSPVSVSGLVIRPRTGEILAMATLPTYDPNRAGSAAEDVRRNRNISDIAEPGSTFKVVVVSAALNEGIVNLTDTFDCEHRHFWYAGKILHDHESYGVLPVQDIIAKSSNIGAAKIGIKLGEERLYDYIRKFGFGTATGVPLPGEVSAARWVPPVKNWSKVSIAQIPMGQGVSVTRLQMTMALCAIANQGWLMRPMLVDRLEDSEHHVIAKYSPQRVRQVIGEPAAKQMVQALKAVVSSEGTAAKAALQHYTVAGKTGTANKVEISYTATGAVANGHYVEKYFSSFIGFFPADNPEVCISISFDEPKAGHFGGQIAAPVFRQVAEAIADYLNIRSEDGNTPDGLVPGMDSRPSRATPEVAVKPETQTKD